MGFWLWVGVVHTDTAHRVVLLCLCQTHSILQRCIMGLSLVFLFQALVRRLGRAKPRRGPWLRIAVCLGKIQIEPSFVHDVHDGFAQ